MSTNNRFYLKFLSTTSPQSPSFRTTFVVVLAVFFCFFLNLQKHSTITQNFFFILIHKSRTVVFLSQNCRGLDTRSSRYFSCWLFFFSFFFAELTFFQDNSTVIKCWAKRHTPHTSLLLFFILLGLVRYSQCAELCVFLMRTFLILFIRS